MFFLWDDWNTEHIARHGVEPLEAEEIVRHARRPYPRNAGNDKFLVKGRTLGGRWLQVVFVHRGAEHVHLPLLLPSERLALIQGEHAVYVIHSRDIRRGER